MTRQEKMKEECSQELEDAFKSIENRRVFIKKSMKETEKACKDLEKKTASKEARLQGTKETKAPSLKPFTEELIDVKDRKELGKLIESAKRENRPWKVVRSTNEGFRYTFCTKYLTEAKNEEEEENIEDDLEVSDSMEVSDEVEQSEETEKESTIEDKEQEVEEPSSDCSKCSKRSKLTTIKDLINQLLEFDEKTTVKFDSLECCDKVLCGDELTLKPSECEDGVILLGISYHEEEPKETSDEEHNEEAEEEPKESEEETEVEVISGEDILELDDEEEVEESLNEASSAEKKAFKHGGQDYIDLLVGRSIARIKDPEARKAAVDLVKNGDEEIAKERIIGDRKLGQATKDIEDKMTSMSDAGMTDESLEEQSKDVLVEEDSGEKAPVVSDVVEIKLDDLEFFKPVAGAKDNWKIIVQNNKLKEFAELLKDFAKDGKMTTSELNDMVWFESDWIFDKLDINPMVKSGDDVIDAEATITEPEEDNEENE